MGFELGLEMDRVVVFPKLKSGRDLVTGKRGPWVWPVSGLGWGGGGRRRSGVWSRDGGLALGRALGAGAPQTP